MPKVYKDELGVHIVEKERVVTEAEVLEEVAAAKARLEFWTGVGLEAGFITIGDAEVSAEAEQEQPAVEAVEAEPVETDDGAVKGVEPEVAEAPVPLEAVAPEMITETDTAEPEVSIQIPVQVEADTAFTEPMAMDEPVAAEPEITPVIPA